MREGGGEGGREGVREGGREGVREGGREGGRGREGGNTHTRTVWDSSLSSFSRRHSTTDCESKTLHLHRK